MTTTPVHTITDEQIAEIEARCLLDMELLRKAAYIRGGGSDKKEYDGVTVEAISDVLGLITRLREAEKDAARLEFMINEQCVMQWQSGTGSPVVYSLAWPQLGETQIEWHATPRAAIDTAMQGDK